MYFKLCDLAFFVLLILSASCTKREFLKESGQVEAFAEMVATDVKPLALGPLMSEAEMDLFMPEAERLAEKYQISFFRESELVKTKLFPQDIAEGKEVLILYKGTALLNYEDLKKRLASTSDEKEIRDLSRRFGRLLGYPSSAINNLLAENSEFRGLEDFQIQGQELIWFFQDLNKAKDFYAEKLGLKLLEENASSATFQIAGDSRLVLKSVADSEYSGQEAKSVALALLTDNLEAWYEHVQKENIPVKYSLKQNPEGAHDGFVAIDPEGYLLEFEMFRQHPENEILMPELQSLEPQSTKLGSNLNFYGSVTWLYYKDMLPMEIFMTENLGLRLSADQGWAKIYRVSENSYLGLVDEKRGMNSFAEEKLVEVKFDLKDANGWEEYLEKTSVDSTRIKNTFKDLGGYLFRF